MPAPKIDLPRKTIIAWRVFVQTPEFRQGIEYLKQNHAPTPGGASDVEVVKQAYSWTAYMKALTDLEDALTEMREPEASLDEPPLQV